MRREKKRRNKRKNRTNTKENKRKANRSRADASHGAVLQRLHYATEREKKEITNEGSSPPSFQARLTVKKK